MKDKTLQIRVEEGLLIDFTQATTDNDTNKSQALTDFMQDYVAEWSESKPAE